VTLGKWGRLVPLYRAGLPYLTFKKLFNFLKCELECFRRSARTKSMPYCVIIEPTNICNLQCPYCPTGAGRESGRKKTMLDISLAESFIEKLTPYLISASFYNWGEPLLHPQIDTLVRMCHERNIFTCLSTNLNIRDLDVLERVCKAGLDQIIVSTSGTTQDVYETYHKGGNLDKLVAGLTYLRDYKKRAKTWLPVVELHYLYFRHNQHELDAARKMAKDLGVTAFRVMDGSGPQEALVGKRDDPKYILSDVKHCHQLWHLMVLNADGGITPCYYLFFKEDDYADASKDDVYSVRNNPAYVFARKLFSPSSTDSLDTDIQHPCLKCEKVHQQKHLERYLSLNKNAKKTHRTGGP
jgi:pyruvate-formate lyase-activating enzyme